MAQGTTRKRGKKQGSKPGSKQQGSARAPRGKSRPASRKTGRRPGTKSASAGKQRVASTRTAREVAAAPQGELPLRTVLEQIRPEFVEEGARRISHDDVAVVIEESAKILGKFRRGKSLERFSEDVKQMLALLGDYWTGTYTRVPYWTIALATFSLLYVLKPVDIIPDVLPGIGELDDALVVSFCLALTRTERQSYRLWVLARELEED